METLLTTLTLQGTWSRVFEQTVEIDFNFTRFELLSSEMFLEDPLEVVSLTLTRAVFTPCELSLFTQHFRVAEHSRLFVSQGDLDCAQDPHLFLYRTKIVNDRNFDSCPWQHEESLQTSSDSTLAGLATIKSLQVSHFSVVVLGDSYLWPELKCLRIVVQDQQRFDQVFATLTKAAPQLAFLHFVCEPIYSPDSGSLVFPALSEVCAEQENWWSFPWKMTGTTLPLEANVLSTQRVDVQGKCKCGTAPPVQFTFGHSNRTIGPLFVAKHAVEVDFSRNGLRVVPDLTFTGCINSLLDSTKGSVEISLNLSVNLLSFSEIDLRQQINQRSVDSCEVKIISLDLSYNRLSESINWKNALSTVKHLRRLYLHHNEYKSLEDMSFRHLTQLQLLDLSHNPLGISKAPHFHIGIIENMITSREQILHQKVDVSHCNLTRIPALFLESFLDDLDVHECTKEIVDGCERYIRQLGVDLSFNNITSLPPDIFELKRLSFWCQISVRFEIDFEGNPLNCSDAKTIHTYRYLTSRSRYLEEGGYIFFAGPASMPDINFYENNLQCAHPPEWKGIPLMQIPEVEFGRLHSALTHCPEGCLCYHTWQHGDVSVANCTPTDSAPLTEFPLLGDQTVFHNLILAHNKLKTLCCQTSASLQRLTLGSIVSLDVSWNALENVCEQFFGKIPNVTHLNLAFNNIRTLPHQISFLSHLRTLDLTSAGLEEFPKELSNSGSLVEVYLQGNKFRCDCDTFWIRSWLNNNTHVGKEPNSLICFSGKAKGKRLIEITQEDVGCYDPLRNKNKQMQKILLSVSGSFVAVSILVAVVLKFKGHIKVWLYAHFNFHPWDKVEEHVDDKDYDAFISYCEADEHWVYDTLVPYLEAPQCGFHLCVHLRDFVPGVAITKNITTAIECSRRTILVLSPNFLNSGWCDFEFQNAHRRVLEDRSNYLIVVLEQVNMEQIDKAFKFYLETRTYVDVKDKRFWDKLLYCMPTVPVDKLKAAQWQAQNDMQAPTEKRMDNNAVNFDRHDPGDEILEMNPLVEPEPRDNMLADLPPLFRRIHTYEQYRNARRRKLGKVHVRRAQEGEEEAPEMVTVV